MDTTWLVGLFRDWTMECGTGEYIKLMKEYPRVTDVFLRLPEDHKEVNCISTSFVPRHLLAQ